MSTDELCHYAVSCSQNFSLIPDFHSSNSARRSGSGHWVNENRMFPHRSTASGTSCVYRKWVFALPLPLRPVRQDIPASAGAGNDHRTVLGYDQQLQTPYRAEQCCPTAYEAKQDSRDLAMANPKVLQTPSDSSHPTKEVDRTSVRTHQAR